MSARTPLAASALVLLALAGCTTGGGGGTGDSDGGSGDGGSGAAGGSAADCISRTWALDVPDAAAQLGAYLETSGGLSVTQSEGSGAQLMTFNDDGTASSDNDVSFVVSVVDGELNLSVVQTHSGQASGAWEWAEGSTRDITFDTWDQGDYTIQTQVLINGEATPTQVSTPSGSLAEGSVMSVECSGDSLTTKITESPFTQHWTARD